MQRATPRSRLARADGAALTGKATHLLSSRVVVRVLCSSTMHDRHIITIRRNPFCVVLSVRLTKIAFDADMGCMHRWASTGIITCAGEYTMGAHCDCDFPPDRQHGGDGAHSSPTQTIEGDLRVITLYSPAVQLVYQIELV